MLPDMSSDWRFRQSPQVTHGGLRSYAGAQLRCKAMNGQEVALGSLCVCACSVQPVLSPAQQSVLVRFADVISAELVNRCREARKQQRHRMACLLAEARTDGPENPEERILDMIRRVYPGVTVDVQTSAHGTIRLANHPDVDYEDFEAGLWEDGPLIEELIQTRNHNELETTRTVRAIAQPCHTYLGARYVVVASNQVQNVFDDVDAWFVESCATQLRHVVQENNLKEALRAKEIFMRGVTHQLRTPIHGVLVSSELLAEELMRPSPPNNALERLEMVSVASALKTIRESGRELMSTVNNIIKMNRWAENLGRPEPTPTRSLRQMETDIMYELHQLVPEQKVDTISMLFDNRIPADDATFEIDMTLLKDCVQALVLNALLYTDQGAVVTVISTSADHSRLVIDVRDTGIGIPPQDQCRIFEAYEKGDDHSRGVGLGLTIARKIAVAMDGNVTLVSSSQDAVQHGSHFCAEFHSPRFSLPQWQVNGRRASHPHKFHVLPGHAPDGGMMVSQFARHLEQHGYQEVDLVQASAVLLPATPDAVEFCRFLESVQSRQVAICLLPAGTTPADLPPVRDKVVLPFAGPFLSFRLDAIRQEVEAACQQALDDQRPAPYDKTSRAASDAASTPPAHAEPHALLVDDNEINLRILRMYCGKRKIPYVTATDGREAVARFREAQEAAAAGSGEAINLVLMDLQMPVCDGTEATAQIRALEQAGEDGNKGAAAAACHIFMVTGQDSVADKNQSFEAGADEFYVKPISLKDLDRGIGDRFPAFKRRLEMSSVPKKTKRTATTRVTTKEVYPKADIKQDT